MENKNISHTKEIQWQHEQNKSINASPTKTQTEQDRWMESRNKEGTYQLKRRNNINIFNKHSEQQPKTTHHNQHKHNRKEMTHKNTQHILSSVFCLFMYSSFFPIHEHEYSYLPWKGCTIWNMRDCCYVLKFVFICASHWFVDVICFDELQNQRIGRI